MADKKLALVTGGSRGIGRAICIKLASEGFDIVFTYNNGKEAADETIKLCKDKGAMAVAKQADVKSSEGCKALVEEVLNECGHIDALVNNAGITRDNLIMRMSDEDLDKVIDTNLKGTFYMMREVSRIMLKQKSGKIVNLSSIVGLVGNAGQVNYAATKAGVIGMTKSLARELAKRHINVNAVAPGFIATDMTEAIQDKSKEALLSTIPFGQEGSAEDVAGAVAFLCSDDARYITGEVIRVDGGMAI